MSAFLAAVESSRLAIHLRESALLFPLLESTHVIGLAFMLGAVFVLDLRLLGVASTDRSFRGVSTEVLPWTWAAFCLTVVTGALMFTTNATVYFGNTAFRVKIGLLALAGLNVLIFELTVGRSVSSWDRLTSAPRAGRVAAAVSVVLWVGVVVAGRVIGFTSTRVQASTPPVEHLEELLGFPVESGASPSRSAPER